MFKIFFLFSLLIIATSSETTEESNKENEKGEGEKGSGEDSGKEKVESENKSGNGSGTNSSGDKELQQLAKLTKGVNAMDKEFNKFVSNYKHYLMDSDPEIARKYGAVVNKTEGKDYDSDKKTINIEEVKKLAKEIRMDMRQFMQNLKGKNEEKQSEGDEGKDVTEENGSGGDEGKDVTEENGSGGDEGKDVTEANRSGEDILRDYNDYRRRFLEYGKKRKCKKTKSKNGIKKKICRHSHVKLIKTTPQP